MSNDEIIPQDVIETAPKVAPEKKVTQPSVPSEVQYRLNVFNASGNVKSSVQSSVYQDVSKRHADVIRSISSTKWMTVDEILDKIWQLEKKMRYPSNRTRKSVESAIKELIERELLETR